MGAAKNLLMKYEDRGYGDVNDDCFCIDCLKTKDEFIKKFIDENANFSECSKCGKNTKIITREELYEIIMNFIDSWYPPAIENYFYDDEEESGFAGPTIDVANIMSLYVSKFLSWDIVDEMIKDIGWSGYSNDPRVNLDLFSTHYKVFLEEQFYDMIEGKNKNFSYELASIFEKYNLYYEVDKLELYRGRTRLKNKAEYDDLISPPSEYAEDNRLSIKGESVFYGAADSETVMAEIGDDDYIQIGKFVINKNLRILDISKINGIIKPSFFDLSLKDEIETIMFLESVNNELSRNDIKSYTSTQMFSHLIQKTNIIDAIIYSSAKKKGSINTVIIKDNEWFKKNINDISFENIT